jgi:hypothetical protein
VGLGVLVAGSLVVLALLAQRVTLLAPSPPSVAPIHPWRQPATSVELSVPRPRPGSLAALERSAGLLRRLRGDQPNRLLTLVAQAAAEAAQGSGPSAPGGSGALVALADQDDRAGLVTETGPATGTTPESPRDGGSSPDGSGGPESDSDGNDNDVGRRREDEDEEEPPDDVEVDDDRDQYAEGSDSGSDGGVIQARAQDDGGDSEGSGSDS